MSFLLSVFPRLTNACNTKCISTSYHDAELNKGESVCLDRCTSKFLEVHEMIGKRLSEMQAAMNDQNAATK